MLERRILPDRAIDYGNGVIGPSLDDQRLANSSTDPLPDFKGKSTQSIDLSVAVATGGAMAFTGAGVAIFEAKTAEASQNNQASWEDDKSLKTADTADDGLTEIAFDFPWPEGEVRYLTGGPHDFTKPIGKRNINTVRDGLDFAFSGQYACQGRPNFVLEPIRVTAAQNGIVTQRSRGHLLIEHEGGYASEYVHTGNVQVKKGDLVEMGQDLGAMSCITPEDGWTTGVHSHFGVQKNGEKIPATQIRFTDGWVVFEDPRNYYGGLQRRDEVITATTSRCGPSKKSIKECDGIRNAILNEPNERPQASETTLENENASTEQEKIDLDYIFPYDTFEPFTPAEGRNAVLKEFFSLLSRKQEYDHGSGIIESTHTELIGFPEWISRNAGELLNYEVVEEPILVRFTSLYDSLYPKKLTGYL